MGGSLTPCSVLPLFGHALLFPVPCDICSILFLTPPLSFPSDQCSHLCLFVTAPHPDAAYSWIHISTLVSLSFKVGLS